MTDKQFQKSGDSVVGAILETLESYDLPEAKVNTVKRIAWSELDRNFGRYIDE